MEGAAILLITFFPHPLCLVISYLDSWVIQIDYSNFDPKVAIARIQSFAYFYLVIAGHFVGYYSAAAAYYFDYCLLEVPTSAQCYLYQKIAC